MICPKCKYEAIDSLAFCPQCGQSFSETGDKSQVDADIVSDAPFVNESSGGSDLVQDAETDISSDSSEPDPDASSSMAPSVLIPEVSQEVPATPAPVAQRPGSLSDTSEGQPSPAVAVPVMTASTLNKTVSSGRKPEDTGSKIPAQTSAKPANVAAIRPAPVTEEPKKSIEQTSIEEPPIPKALKPLTTAGAFWYFFLTAIPCVGLVVLICLAAVSKNQSRRSISRAILLWRLVFVLAVCLLFTLMFFLNREFLVEIFDTNNWYSTGEFLVKTFLNY